MEKPIDLEQALVVIEMLDDRATLAETEKAKLEKDVARLVIERETVLTGLEQATAQLKRDYVYTTLDGHAALIRKLEAIIARVKGETKPLEVLG